MSRVTLKTTSVATLVCEYSSVQDVAKNESTITLSLVIIPTVTIGSWTDFNGSYIGTTSMTFEGSIPKISTERVLATKTMIVKHESDGSKTQTIYWKWGVNSPWGGFENPSGSFNIKLPVIQRATTPKLDVASQYCGSNVIISTPRASSSFTHKLTYKIGDKTGNIASSVGTNYTWTIPMSLCDLMPDETSTIITINCQTLNGTTVVGTKSVNLTIKVPTNVIPTISTISTSEAETSNALGVYIQNKSRLKVNVVSSGSYSSTIKTITSVFNGVKYQGDTFTTGLITKSGTFDITTTVIDSRGRKASKTISISVLSYYSPKITVFKVERCNSDGTLNDNGIYAKVTYAFNIAPIENKNTKSILFEYAEAGGIYTTLKTITDVYTQSSSFITTTTFDINKTYSIRITVTDYFTDRTEDEPLLSEQVILDIKADGLSVAVGKVAEKERTFESGWTFEAVEDTDWLPLTLASGFKAYNTEQAPEYRVKSKTVEIRGAVSPITAFASSNTRVTFATLPATLAPDKAFHILCQGSSKNTWLLSVQPSGDLTISRYGLTEYATVETTAWLTFQTTFTID